MLAVLLTQHYLPKSNCNCTIFIRFYFIHFSRLNSISIILFWENTGSASENYQLFEISNHSFYFSMSLYFTSYFTLPYVVPYLTLHYLTSYLTLHYHTSYFTLPYLTIPYVSPYLAIPYHNPALCLILPYILPYLTSHLTLHFTLPYVLAYHT